LNKVSRKILFLMAVFVLIGFFSKANANDQENIGFFENGKLQEIIQKPYYLYHINRDTVIPFYARDYITWHYSIIEDPDHISEIENPFLCSLENGNSTLCDITKPFNKRVHNKKITQVFINKNKIKDYLNSLSERVDSEPKNGKIGINENEEIYFINAGEVGYKLDVEKSYSEIINVLKNENEDFYIPLATNKIEPELSEDGIGKLGIKEKIATGESNFRGSTKNRIHNIKVAASRFHGLIIKPEEEFSFIENLGEVDGDHGYKKELVIKKNTTVPEFGGGICQISTTAFRVALNAGLEITERHNHAYPVSYYNPPGLDATVYIPAPDLKFINNTGNHILIQTRIEGTKLFFDFYGTSDGRQVELSGPTIIKRTPEGGIQTILYQIIKNADGKEIREDIFKSFYNNHDNYPNPNEIIRNKPKDWSGKQWDEYYAKYGNIIEQLNSQTL